MASSMSRFTWPLLNTGLAFLDFFLRRLLLGLAILLQTSLLKRNELQGCALIVLNSQCSTASRAKILPGPDRVETVRAEWFAGDVLYTCASPVHPVSAIAAEGL